MADTLHFVCPHCAAVNRIPSPRLTEAPKCGQCHQPLFTGHPTELGSANFRKFIERNDVPVVVDFWAPWCGPCQAMAPEYSAATAELEPRVRLAKLNTDAEPALAGEFGIRGNPHDDLLQGGSGSRASLGRDREIRDRALGAGAGLRPVRQQTDIIL